MHKLPRRHWVQRPQLLFFPDAEQPSDKLHYPSGILFVKRNLTPYRGEVTLEGFGFA